MEQHALEASIQALWPVPRWQHTRLLLAISGGADSVALVRAMVRLAPNLELLDVAHFNHCWRGEESDQDAEFVRRLAQSLGLRCYVARADSYRDLQGPETSAAKAKRSEEQARNMRYAFLTDVAYRVGARYVLTAHTASDRIETLLHNLFRGSGLAGLATPSLHRNLDRELVLTRPLLSSTREEVEDYLNCMKQDYRQDSSNADEGYRRNFIRQSLLPLLREQYGPSVDAKLLSFGEIAEQTQNTLGQYASEYLTAAEAMARTAERYGGLPKLTRDFFAFPTATQLQTPWPVVHQALKFVWLDRRWPLQAMNRLQWEQVQAYHSATTADGHIGNLPSDLRIERRSEWILIGKQDAGWH
ncbi:tRNA lysidine(34) synthetase TilS [Aureliella helgolandensis]|uniref:tRNA(Ile)-lysidine synthase n=1 Tax=Aureliella helgolandensis TaxID=2527968 RepID=A0A518G5T6_9BACT|nr:tRNA lysidine(34) synthetase TilS [Aureliella helgolandensis]QDV23945.1 tRNA(Ile)-lysidine synthase [Aureliella helgolandensis]